jgi:DNA-binding XRE family transcriptional regulator
VHLPRTKRLIDQVRSYCKDNGVLQKNLANQVGLSPTAMNEIWQERNNPSCEVGLHLIEIIKPHFMATIVDPPKPPRQAAGTNLDFPRNLEAARSRIASLNQEIGQLKAAAASPVKIILPPASPKAKAQSAGGDPGPDPVYPATGTPGADPLAPTPMPVNIPAVKKAALSEAAVSPVLCQRELDVADFDTVLSMLGNPVHTPMQQACIYAEVKKRRALVSNRFQ